MSSRHGVRAISACVSDVPGVRTVQASLDSRILNVTGTADATAVQTAIRRAGYEAVILSDRPESDGAAEGCLHGGGVGGAGNAEGPGVQARLDGADAGDVADAGADRAHAVPAAHLRDAEPLRYHRRVLLLSCPWKGAVELSVAGRTVEALTGRCRPIGRPVEGERRGAPR